MRSDSRINNKKFCFNSIKFFASMIFFWICTILYLFYEIEIKNHSLIGISRSKRTTMKIEKVFSNIDVISDNYGSKFDVLKYHKRISRINFIFKLYFKRCVDDYRMLRKFIINSELKKYKNTILNNLSIRIPHTIYYEFFVEEIIKRYKNNIIISGQMYDRFAEIEYSISKKYGKKLIVIPHGVETSKEMPVAYSGDVFYCTSEVMKNQLNKLYNTEKFRYNSCILQKMYSLNSEKISDKKVVFFTQPGIDDVCLSLIEEINKNLSKHGIELLIKIHPLETKEKYRRLNLKTIDNFEEAICNSICISLFSTILLEAIYNNSVPISIIHLIGINELKDDYFFLENKKILKPTTMDELINNIYNNKR